jgi:NitT/TauT family transport system ATP-binding protein
VPLFAAMRDAAGEAYADEAAAHGRALAKVVAARRAAGESPLVFAMTYPFSSHNYEFRFWMAEAGIDPDRDVTMTVVPPPLTADALKAGAIDGFCVNAPWNVLAVEAGIGRIVAVKADIWPSSACGRTGGRRTATPPNASSSRWMPPPAGATSRATARTSPRSSPGPSMSAAPPR